MIRIWPFVDAIVLPFIWTMQLKFLQNYEFYMISCTCTLWILTCIFTVPFNELFIVVSWHVLNLRIHVFTLYVYMCFTITVYFCVFSGRIWVYAAELVWRVQIFPSVPRERITHYSSIVRRNHWERISNVSVKISKCIVLHWRVCVFSALLLILFDWFPGIWHWE